MVREDLPEDLLEVLEQFVAAGHEVWIVGGALRDRLLGATPKDWDLATSASPQEVMRLFPRVVPIGVRHGTVQVHSRLRSIEVTSCPGEGRDRIREDLKRRDFTVNALALSYPDGVLLDLFGGQQDLSSGLLRAVGDARARFREDPLRTLRAGRFISVHGFHLEPQTFTALEEAAPRLQEVAGERIREELFKMLLGKHVREGFEVMIRGRVVSGFLPEFSAAGAGEGPGPCGADAVKHAVAAVSCCPYQIRVRLAALFHNLAEVKGAGVGQETLAEQARHLASARVAEGILQRWRVSRRLTREVAWLVEQQLPDAMETWRDGDVRRFLARVGEERLADVLALAYAERMVRRDQSSALAALANLQARVTRELSRRPPLRLQDLAITGREVMRVLNLRPGPLVGQLLEGLHHQVLENPNHNEAKILMDFLRKEYNFRFQSELEADAKKQNQGG